MFCFFFLSKDKCTNLNTEKAEQGLDFVIFFVGGRLFIR